MKTKVGKILVESSTVEHQKYNGAEYFRRLVEWMNNRDEWQNENKSNLQLMREFNNKQP